MSSQPFSGDDRPLLKLHAADQPEEGDDGGGALTPFSRLSDLFLGWFVPIVLEPEGTDEATITSYHESIGWWKRLTGDPPLHAVDAFTIARFRTGLKEATYTRGLRGAPRKLSGRTIIKHERQVNTVLYRAGSGDDKRAGAGLLAAAPRVNVTRASKQLPKPHFSLSDVRAILAAAPRMPPPKRIAWPIAPGPWWLAFLATLFYTGLRTGTVRRLTWSMLVADPAGDRYGWPGHWLVIPGSITKTDSEIRKLLHPDALAAIERLRPRLAASERALIFPFPNCDRHLIERHAHVQQLAELPPSRSLSPHAWRRTHANEMFRLGAKFAREVAQKTLDHANSGTTREFYVDGEAQLIALLPSVLPPLGDRQLELF